MNETAPMPSASQLTPIQHLLSIRIGCRPESLLGWSDFKARAGPSLVHFCCDKGYCTGGTRGTVDTRGTGGIRRYESLLFGQLVKQELVQDLCTSTAIRHTSMY